MTTGRVVVAVGTENRRTRTRLKFRLPNAATVTALRLEALPDESLARQGSGRGQRKLRGHRVSKPESKARNRSVALAMCGSSFRARRGLAARRGRGFQRRQECRRTAATPSQSSHGRRGGGEPRHRRHAPTAILRNEPVTQTESSDNPWWELDLMTHRADRTRRGLGPHRAPTRRPVDCESRCSTRSGQLLREQTAARHRTRAARSY